MGTVNFYSMDCQERLVVFLFRVNTTVLGWWKNFVLHSSRTKHRSRYYKKLGPLELSFIKDVILDEPTVYLDESVSKVEFSGMN